MPRPRALASPSNHDSLEDSESFPLVALRTSVLDSHFTVSHAQSGPTGNPIEVQVWQTKVAGHPNVLQDDGNLVFYDEKEPCKAWWASESARGGRRARCARSSRRGSFRSVAGVSINGVRVLVAASGARPQAFLARVGMPIEVYSNDDARVALDDYLLIVRTASSLAADPALGLHVGSTINPASFDAFGALLQTSETLRVTIALLNRYAAIAVDGLRFELEENADRALLRLGLPREVERFAPFFAEVAFSALVRHIIPSVTGSDPTEVVHFAHDAPAHRGAYTRIFGGRERFASTCYGVELQRDALDRRAAAVSQQVHEMLRERADMLLTKLDQGRGVRERVLSWLELNGGVAKPRMREAARALGTSERTLRRLLAREQAEFSSLVDSVRAKRATTLLLAGRHNVQQVALELGFESALAFSRAYRRWTGSSPSSVLASR
jgi:AraC-like DNA-binding protein